MATFDAARAVLLEIDTKYEPPNGCVYFQPLGETIRGRHLFYREPEILAMASLRQKFGPTANEIPGQRLGYDASSRTGFVDDLLHERQWEGIAKSIRKLNFDLPPARQLHENQDPATWIFWMKRLVEDGLAVVIQGKLPDKIEGKPRTRFLQAEPTNGTANDLATLKTQLSARDAEMAALREQMNALLTGLAAKAK